MRTSISDSFAVWRDLEGKMTIHFEFPDVLTPKMLDSYLAEGWFRMRQAVFTCRYVMGSGILYTAVWIRVQLPGFVFSRSLRKLKGRNSRAFRHQIGPMVFTDEHHRLYSCYRDNFHSDISQTLDEALFDEEKDIFDSMIVNIYDGDKLIAFSIFDKGLTALQGIKFAWDPDYAKHSLGLYTMILQVEYGQNHGFEYYYPGYIAPGCSFFDYKTRFHPFELWDPIQRSWLPGSQLDINGLPSNRMKAALSQLQEELNSLGVDVSTHLYPPYRYIWDDRFDDCLKIPIFMMLRPREHHNRTCMVVIWDVTIDAFVVYECNVLNNLEDYMTPLAKVSGEPKPFYYLLRIKRQAARSQFIQGISSSIQLLLSR